MKLLSLTCVLIGSKDSPLEFSMLMWLLLFSILRLIAQPSH
ncbi:hypothetical protein [Enterococcus phage vB_Efs6_KEN16]|uniref:Uncharacterized protein n=1 Tax=Enterococcus phage vB_Efs6_KEN16 TaxID=3138325 RepID=A0AAX4PRM1_9CAUD